MKFIRTVPPHPAPGASGAASPPAGRAIVSGVDALLALASACGLALVAWLLISAPPLAPLAGGADRRVAILAFKTGQVLSRAPGTLVWRAVRMGDALREREAVFVPPGAMARLALREGASLDIEENSLVVLEPVEAAGEADGVALLRGSVSGSGGKAPLGVRSPGGVAIFEPGTRGRLATAETGRPVVEIYSGRASVDGQTSLPSPSSVRLESPPSGQRFWTTGRMAPIPLLWDGAAAAGLRLEVARDRSFAGVVTSLPAERGAALFQPPAPGTFYWRIGDGAGGSRSEERLLLVLENRPPTPLSPLAGEIVLAPAGHETPFLWTAVEGATRYRLEIASDAGFEKPAFAADAEGPGLWTDPRLAEGVYWWRVRVADEDRPDSRPSLPVPFRIVQAPVPDAPQLFDPTIEVEHGAGR